MGSGKEEDRIKIEGGERDPKGGGGPNRGHGDWYGVERGRAGCGKVGRLDVNMEEGLVDSWQRWEGDSYMN